MHEVGHYLQVHAHRMTGEGRDAFARSAYNRYYYACFLAVREELLKVEPSLSLGHAQYPEHLQGKILKKLKEERRRAIKIDDRDLTRIIDSALRGIPILAKILKNAYALRVVADYEPEIPIEFHGADRFSLQEVSITSAHNWLSQIETLLKTLSEAWDQINV